ncbi:MAG: ferredoxin [Verrucomicrobiota bacterium]|nr:ferredoxin [Verrucomicrobiota bacterium]
MRAIVDREKCIGCGQCAEICPAVFEMVDDVAVVKTDPVPTDQEVACRQAADSCPVEGIVIVDEP